MDGAKKKRGRPAQPGSRRNRVYVYLSDMELNILRNASETSGKSISEIARIGTLKSSSAVLSESIRDGDAIKSNKNSDFIDENELGYYEDDGFYDE